MESWHIARLGAKCCDAIYATYKTEESSLYWAKNGRIFRGDWDE